MQAHGEKSVLVTVGTTKFQKLIEVVSSDEILNILKKLGYTSVLLQIGTGAFTERSLPPLKLKYCSYVEDFASVIESVSLIISHAGAGTCLEVLQRNKPLIVVINEELMDNHQIELAEELQDANYAFYCTCNTLASVLLGKDLLSLTTYPIPKPELFNNYVNNSVGFR